jgi:hypothetical protein
MAMVSTASGRQFQLHVVMEGEKTVVLFFIHCNSFMISLTAMPVAKIM